jgi:hypothetical protein
MAPGRSLDLTTKFTAHYTRSLSQKLATANSKQKASTMDAFLIEIYSTTAARQSPDHSHRNTRYRATISAVVFTFTSYYLSSGSWNCKAYNLTHTQASSHKGSSYCKRIIIASI